MLHKPQRVVMLVAKYWPEMGGAENQLRSLSRELYRKNVDVWIVTRNYHRGPSQEKLDHSTIFRMPTLGENRWMNSLLYMLGSLFFLWKHRKRFDVLHCHQAYSPLTIGVLAKIALRKPCFVKMTASHEFGEVEELKKLPFLQFRKKLLKKVTRFFVVNPWITSELATLGVARDRTLWIPNGVDLELIQQKKDDSPIRRKDLHFQDDDFVLVFTGRFSKEKNLDILLQSIASLSKKYPQIRVLLVGAGGANRNVEQELRDRVKDLGIEPIVTFTGKVDNVFPYLDLANVFTLLSTSEGMSNSLLEAMACALPVIVSDIPANQCVVEEGKEGKMVAVRDLDSLTQVIEWMIQNPSFLRKASERAFQKIVRQFQIKDVAAMIYEQYQKGMY